MKNFNLTQMLQGCSKRNEMTVSATNSGGGQTCQVKQQTRLTSVEEKWCEKEALNSTCLRNAFVIPPFCFRYVAMIFAVLVMSVANVGMAWGTTYYVVPAKCNVTAGALVTGNDGSVQLFKTDESTITVNTDIATSLTGTGSLYYNSTSTTYSNLTNTSNYSTGSSSNRTMRGIQIAASANCTITVNSKRFSKLDVIYRCHNNASSNLTIDGQDCNTTDSDIHIKSITKDYSSNIIIHNGSSQPYSIFVILTEAEAAASTKRIYMEAANGWNNSTPYFYAKSWGVTGSTVLMTQVSSCETNVFYADIPSGDNNILFTRQSTNSGIKYKDETGNYNQSVDINCTSNDKFTFNGDWNKNSSGKSDFNYGTYSAPAYTVTYNKNGDGAGGAGDVTGSVPTDSNSPYSCGDDVTVLGNTGSLALAGYSFNGWNTAANGSGTAKTAGQTYSSIAANTTFYAQWTREAPTSVSVTGGFAYFPGQTITFTAVPTGGTSGFSYQWQKKTGASYNDIDGATSATYTKSNCTISDCGSYRCKVSKAGLDVYSDAGGNAHNVRIHTLNGNYTGEDFESHNITYSSGTSGTVTLSLNANSVYEFKIYDNYTDGRKEYGYATGNYIISPVNYDCGTNNANIRLFTGPAGDYTFTVNLAHVGDNSPYVNVAVAYPSVTHPAEGYAYFEKPNDWTNVYLYWYTSDSYRMTNWEGAPEVITTANICGTTYYYAPVGTEFDYLKLKGNGTNEWTAISTSGCSGKYMDETTYASPAWTAFPTYTISFAGNSNTGGSMSDIGSITANKSQTITSNAFTKTGHTFAGWKADVDVKINGSTVSAGTVISNGATIQNICSDIELTAQWNVNNYDLTWNLGGGTTTSAGTGIASGVSSNTTTSQAFGTALTAPTVTKDNYTFSAWSPSVASTMPAANTTYTATWTAETHDVSVTLTDSKATQESGSTGEDAATYGTNYVATFEAVSGYELPDDVAVTIGGDDAEKGTEYSWSVSAGVGTLTITGSYITGDIAITVTATASCSTPDVPDGLAAGTISSSGVTFTITDDEDTNNYEIYYSTSSTAPTGSTEASATTTSKSKAVTGLTANTTYYAWVRAVCNDDYKSDWVALTGSTFKTLAAGTKYYLFTPTSAPNPSHTGTLSGAFISPSATSSSEKTIDTYTFTKNITFSSTQNSISGQQAGDKNITYYNKTSSTKFTLYVDNTNGSQQILYISKIVEGETSVTVANCTIPASTAKSVELTYETSDNTTFGFSVGNSQLVIYQIVAEEAGTAHKVAGENGYALNLNKGRVSCPLSSKADISVNGFLIKAPYNNYKFTNSTELQIEKDKESSTYIKFTTPASPGRLKLTYTGSSGVQMAYNTSASDEGATSITSASAYTLSASTTYYLVNTGTQTAKITKIEFVAPLSGYTVSITADPDGYGTVSSSSVTSVASGTTLSTSTNTLSVGATNVTASATSASAEYTYAFSNWTKSDGTALPSTVTADLSVYANFTRTANNYTLTWNTNGGSDLDGDYTSGSTAYGASITAPTDPTLSNYTFDGWKTNNDGTGTTAGAAMPAANTTYYAAWKQTVTLTTGAQGSGDNQTPYVYKNGTAVSSFTAHTASGYTLNGYYTASSGGTKVLNADGSFAAANVTDYITSSKWSRTGAAPTLYAQWRAAAGKTCYTWDAEETHPQTGTNSYGGLYLTISQKGKYQFNSGGTNDTCFYTSSKSHYIKGHINGTVIDSLKFKASTENGEKTAVVVAFCSTYPYDTAHIIQVNSKDCKVYSVNKYDAAESFIKIKAPTGAKSFAIGRNFETELSVDGTLANSGKRYIYYVEACSAGGGTHTISYNNGGGSGSMSSNTGITDDDSQTLSSNTFSAPTNYSFAGWVADVNVTIGGSTVTAGTLIANSSTITNITSDIALTAKWSQSLTLDDNDENHGATGNGSATAYYNATSLSSITHTKATTGYKLSGYYTAKTDGTKVLNADGSFVGSAVTGWISDSKWTQNTTSTPTLYAQYESAGALTWNLVVKSDTSALSTSTKTSAFTEISTANMSNATVNGLTYTGNAKASLTGKISTPAYDAGKYVYVTFQIASGYKFTPSSIKVPVQPVGNNEHKAVELRLTDDASHSLVSASATKCDGTSDGKKTTVSLAGDGTYFTGTVTLKIYVYPDASATASSNNCYRLGTPITIEGEIEEACGTMPSYSSMSYSQTDYTVGDSPSAITISGATNVDAYLWKSNTTNDRSGGSSASGTNDGSSYTPSTPLVEGTTYYWCEMTNTSCGITIKTPAVAINVSASKSTASVTWDPKAKLGDSDTTAYYGGKNYTLKATLNSGWDGTLTSDMFTAPSGIRLHDFTIDNSSNPKTIEATFDVQTAFDIDENDSIAFTLSLPATATYNALSSEKKVAYNECSSGGGSASEELMPVNADSVNSTVKGWRFMGKGKMWYGHGSSAPSTGSSNIKSLSNTMADGDIDKYYNTGGSYFTFYTEKAITGIRFYVYTSNSNVKVSNVYIANSQFATGTPSSGAVKYEVVYNDDNEGLDKGDNYYSAWAEITFASEVAAGKYGLIKLDNNVKIAGIGLLSNSGSGASQTTTLAFATAGPINDKTQSSANFTNVASLTGSNANSLGAITYSSNNTSCATVNATTGEVTITATGSSDLSATITATLAASGCFKGATTTYTINIPGQECTISSAGTLSTTATSKCESDNVTLTLTGEDTDGTTVTWYRDETNVTASVSKNSLTTSTAGTYSVVVSNATCSKRSNSITISNINATASVTKIVDEWYVKNGRLTPDIALWTMSEGATLESVTWDDTNETGLSCYARDGVIYLEGKEPSSNESGADIEYTLTATILDACGGSHEETTKTIKITHQKNTDKHVLAFVVEGTAKGGFTAGITAAQTTDVDLYNTIATNFDVLATNIYSTDDEKKLKEYYSQFDILCITDYPNTKTKGVNSKSYVDAMGALVDIRPILTMEAWVSGLTNWKAKGISGTPSSPTTRQYTMLLQCKDHEIFSGTELTKVGEGDETMYRISMVCDTLEDYKTLDATYGSGTHEKDKNYQYGKKPALQGFTFDATMADDGLLPLGLIDDGAGNDLQVGIERQTEMEARLMVLGINSYAMERLTDDGQTVVVNALKYLMKKNSEDIADCSNTFVGGDDEEDESTRYDWNVDSHWSGNAVPERTQKVRIVAPCVIKADEKFHVTGVVIAPSGKYNHGANTANGSLTIAAGGALIVDGKVEAATAPLYTETRATSAEDLVLQSNSSAQAALILDNSKGETQATVTVHSEANKEGSTRNWQYLTSPLQETPVTEFFYGVGTYTYKHSEADGGWVRYGLGTTFHAFDAIGLTQNDKKDFVFYGPLAPTGEWELNLTNNNNGNNLFGNSWTAPIDLKALVNNTDFDSNINLDLAIYNTGANRLNGGVFDQYENADDRPGTWHHVPLRLATLEDAGWTGMNVIPAYQAFQLKATGAATLNIDYDKCVRGSESKNYTEPLRAPRRRSARRPDSEIEALRLAVSDANGVAYIYLLEGEQFTEGYDNGWELSYTANSKYGKLYAISPEQGNMMALARPYLEGTMVGFQRGQSNEYTITFNETQGNYYLNDLRTQQSTLIQEGESYTFTVEEGEPENRFLITSIPYEKPGIATGVTDLDAEAPKVQKVIYNDKLYIIRGGKVFSADGQIVR